MEKTYEKVATILLIIFAMAGLANMLLLVLAPQSILTLVLLILAGVELVVFFLFGMVDCAWRSKIRSLDEMILRQEKEKLNTIRRAYKQWLENHDLTDLITTLEMQVGEPHTAEETGG